MLVKAFSGARDILFEELQKISKAINQSIDFTDFTSKFDDEQGSKFPPSADTDLMNGKASGEVPSKISNGFKVLSCYPHTAAIYSDYAYVNIELGAS